MAEAVPLHDPVTHALASAALEPGLRSILYLDAAPSDVVVLGARLAEMIRLLEERTVHEVVVGSGESEEDLWDGVAWVRDGHSVHPMPVAGPLGPRPNATKVIVIPDLSRVSLAAARACIVTMDAPAAHLERHGRSLAWDPTGTAWVAGCARELIGRVSPHLLDRFALRISSPPEAREARLSRLRRAVGVEPRAAQGAAAECDPEIAEALRRAQECATTMGADAIGAVIAASYSGGAGARRDVALARLAAATARLSGASRATGEHVRIAAEVLGGVRREEAEDQHQSAAQEPVAGDSGRARGPVTSTAAGVDVLSGSGEAEVRVPEGQEAFEATTLSGDTLSSTHQSPYPEDDAVAEREPEPLRRPPTARGPVASTGGVAVGVQPATRLQDLALTSTVVEALKWQPVRRAAGTPEERALILSPADLRAYRRAPARDTLLGLVVDFTCRRDRLWPDVLLPYLQWAYTRRAAVCLVRVGAGDADHVLRADRILARSVLDPRLIRAMETPAGSATPLAHGLHLARETLVHALHHRRAGVGHAKLVVATDGRGNVPLSDSLRGEVAGAVRRAGVEDAEAVATQIAALDRVETVLVDPGPTELVALPRALAAALRAGVVPIDALSAGDLAEVA